MKEKRKTKRTFKSTLCLVLALAMCAGLMPSGMTALAASATDEHTVTLVDDPDDNGMLYFDGSKSSVRSKEFAEGDTVTVDFIKSAGYEIGTFTVVEDATGDFIDAGLKADGDGFTFVMPNSDVTVSAEFMQVAEDDYGIMEIPGSADRKSTGKYMTNTTLTYDEFYAIFNKFMNSSYVKNQAYAMTDNAFAWNGGDRWDCSAMVLYFVGYYLMPYCEDGASISDLPQRYSNYSSISSNGYNTVQQLTNWGKLIYDADDIWEDELITEDDPGDLQPGDLLYYGYGVDVDEDTGEETATVTHVAMYLGDGKYLNDLSNLSGKYTSGDYYQVENVGSTNSDWEPVEGKGTDSSGSGVRTDAFRLHFTNRKANTSDKNRDVIAVVRLVEINPYSYLTMEKTSENPSITDGNSCYSLNGAEYTVYTDKGCTTVAKDSDGNDAVFTIKADGTTSTIELEPDTYYLYETKVPEGYKQDTQIHVVELTVDYTEDEPYTVSVTECPINDPASIMIYKLDKDTGEYVPEGEASLEGAEFTVDYYDGYYETEAELPSNATRSWVIQTKWDEDEQKYAAGLDEKHKVSGDDFYYQDGDVVLPLGTYAIYETKAPTGYLLEGAFTDGNGVTVEAGEKFVSVLQNKGDAEWIVGGNYYTQEEPVIRGGVEIQKRDWDTDGTEPKLFPR